jgi:two-component system, sensor histidine kinase and response regulator
MEPLDWNALRENCAGDESLVNEVLDLFRAEADALVSDVGVAITSGDAVGVKRAAHRLKGALVSLGAKPATEGARALEICGGSGDLSPAPALYATLEHEMTRLLRVISLPVAA